MITDDDDNKNLSGGVVAHQCPYCPNTCLGKQCKECHKKMVETRNATFDETKNSYCCDCNKPFMSLRKDGSKRVRCFFCQKIYKETYIINCPDCNIEFHSRNKKDGRIFDKCFSCYKKRFTKCRNCEKNTLIEYPLCKECYFHEKQAYIKEKYGGSNQV